MTLESFITDACLILNKEIDQLEPLAASLKAASSVTEKIEILDSQRMVGEFLKKPSLVRTLLRDLSPECQLVIKSIIAIGQAEKIFHSQSLSDEEKAERIGHLMDSLLPIEKFYSEIGGLVGYHLTMIKFLCRPVRSHSSKVVYHSPQGVDISQKAPHVDEAIFWGIEKMPELAEIYPVGGAADRLRLHDPLTGHALPAAKLFFCGKTLLERLVSDVQAREYLYYKLKNKQITIPIAMMTSKEKDNHHQILSICAEKGWFQRGEENFFFFCQPSVPTLNKEGNWGMQGELQLLLRPGGHGVIWKLARDEGVFSWFQGKQIKKALVRQINNPIASEDYGLLAFCGLGQQHDKRLGFSSCSRQVKASEGINVLLEEKKGIGYEYTLTNIEYCDFKKYHIADEPVSKGSPYSKFPSNTNLLFIDLDAILETIDKCPIPGMLVNLKKIAYRDDQGELKEQDLARLESTMQNIADCFKETYLNPLGPEDLFQLKSFLTFNHRRKTISTTKREYLLGASLLETPEGCFIDMMHNAKELLEKHCGFKVPALQKANSQDEITPSFLFFYHPALGPLYSIIGQKLRQGSLKRGSELQLHVAEIEMQNVDIEGSLCVYAEQIMGHRNAEGVLCYSEQTGKCILKNVKVRNQGIDYKASNIFWKNEIYRKESCSIILEGNAEFFAENVVLQGGLSLHVEAGHRMVAWQEGEKVFFKTEKINGPSWTWRYSFDSNKQIQLEK